jgi:hypothetical protein
LRRKETVALPVKSCVDAPRPGQEGARYNPALTRIETKRRVIITAAAIAGMMGPALFGSVLLALSALEYSFMLGIGWQPIADPAGAWPSALALGPHGLVQVANFVVSGLL